MKSIIQLSLLGFVFAILFSSCEKENLHEETIVDLSQSSDLKIINQLGFDKSTIIDMGDYYLAEGDISIPKENINGYKELLLKDNSPITRQAYTNDLLSISNVSDIKIKIDASLNSSSNWRTAILDVMRHYNNIASGIYMYEVSSNPDITISYSLIDAWGKGEFPTADGKAGKSIKIQNSSAANKLSLLQKTFLIAHEMGHNLGFRHTDYLTAYYYPAEGTGKYGANHVPNTPIGTASYQDPNSVFNSGFYHNGNVIPWDGFSNYDKIAIKYVYPKLHNSKIVGDKYAFLSSVETYYLDYDPCRFSLEDISWSVNGNLIPSSKEVAAIRYKFDQLGTNTVKCSVKFSTETGIIAFDKEFEVTVYPDINYSQWRILNARVNESNQLSFDLVYKAMSEIWFNELYVLLLYTGTFDNSIYSVYTWDWIRDPYKDEYTIPTVNLEHGFSEYFGVGRIQKWEVCVKQVRNHPIHSNYDLSDIELAIIYTNTSQLIRHHEMFWGIE